MRIYLASGIDNRALMRVLEGWLHLNLGVGEHSINLEFTSRWYWTDPIEVICDCAQTDFDAIDEADLVIGVYPSGPGTSSELGYAIGAGKPVIYYLTHADLEHIPLPVGLWQTREHVNIAREPAALLNRIAEYA